jgi:hypothetical protein
MGVGACVSSPAPLGERREPIIGGVVDAADRAVVAIVQTSTGAICSGTVIAPSVVLTAAHCVYGVAAGDLQVFVGTDQSAPEETLAVTSAVAYPTYDGETTGLAGGVDLGVLYLAQPASVTPISVRTAVRDTELAAGPLTLVGYGRNTTTDATGAGTRRSVAAVVDAVCSRILLLGDDVSNECFGDSGGAVLLGGALVAVISSGKPDCIAPSNQVRLSAHALWLDAALQGEAAAACPGCVAPDPACDAPIEGGATIPDAGAPDAATDEPGSGGCRVQRAPSAAGVGAAPGALLVALGGAAAARRRGRRRR